MSFKGWLFTLLTVGLVLPAQTISPVRKDGRYWVQTEQGSLPAGGRLRVSSTGGIAVRGESSRQVSYTVVKKLRARNEQEAEQLLRKAQLTASRQGTTVVISLDDPRCGRCGFSARMDILAPSSTEQTLLSTRGGALRVENVEGRVNAETAGGSIDLDRIGGDVRATTAGGSIELGSIGGDIRCETAGGSIAVDKAGGDAVLTTSGGGITAGEVAGTLRAETAGGNIRVEKVGSRVVAGTSGGSIHVGQASGSVDAETAGGSIHVASAPGGVRAETAGGDVRLNDVAGAVIAASAAGNIQARFLAGSALADSLLETNAGTIVVWLPEGVAVTVQAIVDFASSLSRIRTEFSAITVQRTGLGFGPGKVTAEGALNGGGPILRIRNTSGRIQIRKRP